LAELKGTAAVASSTPSKLLNAKGRSTAAHLFAINDLPAKKCFSNYNILRTGFSRIPERHKSGLLRIPNPFIIQGRSD